jgi:hypothetical protein
MISEHLKGYYCFIPCDRNFIDGKKPLDRIGDFNNNLINTWESAVIAGKSLNINSNEITRCLKKDNIYKNSKWFYSPIVQ